MDLIAIIARSKNNVMGNGNKLPWPRDKQDLEWFRDVTTGHPIIMGSLTYLSLPKKLKDREHIVLTRHPHGFNWHSDHNGYELPDRSFKLHELDAWLTQQTGRVFVIGGAQTLLALNTRINGVMLRTFDAEYKGDVLFPEIILHGRKSIMQERWDHSVTEFYL